MITISEELAGEIIDQLKKKTHPGVCQWQKCSCGLADTLKYLLDEKRKTMIDLEESEEPSVKDLVWLNLTDICL